MFGAEFIADPYAFYARLRQGPPLTWSRDFCGGAWLVHRHADVQQALRDPDLSARRIGGWVAWSALPPSPRLQTFKSLMARTLVFLDRPRHTRVRRVLNTAFTPDALRTLEPVIHARCREVTQQLQNNLNAGRADLIRDVCQPLPALVMMDMLGLRELPVALFQGWAMRLARFIGQPTPDAVLLRDTQEALLDMADCLQSPCHIAQDGLAWRLLHDDSLSLLGRQERLAQCCMLLFAGYETSRHLLGNMLLTLIERDALREDLIRRPERIPAAVREFLRHDSPVQYTARRVGQDCRWHGQALRKGQLLVLLLGAANRDPSVFPDPQRLDFDRPNQAELSLGHGIHRCLGAGLVQMEARLALHVLLPLLPTLIAAQGRRLALPAYRGWQSLPVRQAMAA